MDKQIDSKHSKASVNHAAAGSRIAETGSSSFKAEDKLAEICANIEHLNLRLKPKFVINTIAFVPECDSPLCKEESSDEEDDNTFSHENFNFDLDNRDSYPFTTTPPKYARKRDIILNLVKGKYFSSLNKNDSTISRVVEPFLSKIAANSFKDYEKHYLKSHVSASIGLNRMKSLSSRKNNSLMLEMQRKVYNVAEIRYEVFGIFWLCQWYTKNGKTVDQSHVTKFYKQLKRIDLVKAQKFRESEEHTINVPYQQLREYLKNHDNTKKLVQEFRRDDKEKSNIYISLIDADTVDFNGIYSAYWRIVDKLNLAPTVMSTGYEYSEDEPVFQTASHIDRMIRVKTAKHFPLGVYYPEPNTCFLIEQGCDTLKESFIDKRRKKGDLESSRILRKIKNRPDAVFVFSSDNPLITTIPDRARTTKRRNCTVSTIPFSPEFIQGASPTKTDFKSLKQVAQSSFHEYIWYSNIFINDAIRFIKDDKKYKLQRSKKILAKIRNSESDSEKFIEFINELKTYVNSEDVDSILDAVTIVKLYVESCELNYIRSENEDKLLNILKKDNIETSSLSKDRTLLFSHHSLISLFEEKIVNISDLMELDDEILERICYNEEVLDALRDHEIDFKSLLYLLENEDHGDIDQAIMNDYSFVDILKKYEEHPLHLAFMVDANGFMYENSHDENIVSFGIENYRDILDIEMIRDMILGDREDSNELMHFDAILSFDEEEPYELL